MSASVRAITGLDALVADSSCDARRRLSGQRVAVLCHPPSVDRECVHILERLQQLGVRPTILFGPEHGIGGEAQDMATVGDVRHPRFDVPIVSLYGATLESLRIDPSRLADVDVLLIDLQDVGARYYTYVWTAAMALESCAESDTVAVVLDRPNPIGGTRIEGPTIDEGFQSFVGWHPVPVRHGMTVAELMQLYRSDKRLDVELVVQPMCGWRREMYFDDTGLPWVLPSPNMPTLDTAIVYCGGCLLEGTNASEGRGATRPFEFFGAPYVDAATLCDRLTRDCSGARFRPLSFLPTFQKHAGTACSGAQVHVVDREAFAPLRFGVATTLALSRCAGFEWREQPYEFVSDTPAIDLLAGGTWLREACEAEADVSVDALCAQWQRNERDFAARREPFLLYRQ